MIRKLWQWFGVLRPETVRSKGVLYLDYAAATPLRPEVAQVIITAFTEQYANPSATHAAGRVAREVLEAARTRLARTLQVRPADVIFTGSGTESNNMAISGVLEAQLRAGCTPPELHVITSNIEHPSITETLRHWRVRGVQVTELPVNEFGLLEVEAVRAALSPQTVLITTAYVNSEIGTIAPVRKLARLVESYNSKHKARVWLHVDAAQAPLWLPCALNQLGADLVSLDAGKCYGPKGVGVLAWRHGVSLAPVLFGGGQERGLRSGTENVPLILGAVKALIMAQEGYAARAAAVTPVRDAAIKQLTSLPGVMLNGHQTERVANNINVSIEGVDGEFAAVTLDVAGIACATKSACGSGKGSGSSVVRALSGDTERALTSLRFSLGEDTTLADINRLTVVLGEHINNVQAARARGLTNR